MKKLSMPELRTRKFRVKEGWAVMAPDFFADPEYESALTGALMPQHGHSRDKALKDARKRIDDLGRQYYLHQLRLFVRRCLDDYARRFPHLVQSDRTLKGFDASLVSRAYIPYRKQKSGPFANPEIANILIGMARKAQEEAA